MARFKINPHTGRLDRVDDSVLDESENDIIDKAESLDDGLGNTDRKSTRLNYSHTVSSYDVFCLNKKKSIENHFILDDMTWIYHLRTA